MFDGASSLITPMLNHPRINYNIREITTPVKKDKNEPVVQPSSRIMQVLQQRETQEDNYNLHNMYLDVSDQSDADE